MLPSSSTPIPKFLILPAYRPSPFRMFSWTCKRDGLAAGIQNKPPEAANEAGRQSPKQLLTDSEDHKTTTMHWLTPGIETYAAYGTCLLLLGMLVLSVRNRKA